MKLFKVVLVRDTFQLTEALDILPPVTGKEGLRCGKKLRFLSFTSERNQIQTDFRQKSQCIVPCNRNIQEYISGVASGTAGSRCLNPAIRDLSSPTVLSFVLVLVSGEPSLVAEGTISSKLSNPRRKGCPFLKVPAKALG